MSPEETDEDMVQILDEKSPVKKWTAEFKWSRDSTEDDSWSGHPKTSTSDEQVNIIHCMVWDERRLTVQQMANSISIRSGLGCPVLS